MTDWNNFFNISYNLSASFGHRQSSSNRTVDNILFLFVAWVGVQNVIDGFLSAKVKTCKGFSARYRSLRDIGTLPANRFWFWGRIWVFWSGFLLALFIHISSWFGGDLKASGRWKVSAPYKSMHRDHLRPQSSCGF